MMERLLMVIAAATVATAARGDDAAVRATLQRAFPQSPIQGITKTPVPGVLEAAIEGQVFYITADGRYILGGPLFDAKANRNLTEVRIEQINAIPFNSLPLDWAFKRVKGTGARRIAIFEDPDCPYCKTLEQTLEGIDNLTVYVFLYPIDQIHPDATAKSKAVWCAKDRVKAWDDAMRTGTVPAGAADCDNPIAKIADFMKRHRITGTPTTILADGRRLVGAVPRAELETQLQKAAKR
ncbi:DsbC family protein [Polaromonas sp. P1(28)-13]|nr:DsbC family protein [Polaromonas sp. P1(28)-13]